MAKANLNKQTKRRRELAKKEKRAAKDEKRAVRKAEARVARAVTTDTALPATPETKVSVSSLAAAAFIRRMKTSH